MNIFKIKNKKSTVDKIDQRFIKYFDKKFYRS